MVLWASAASLIMHVSHIDTFCQQALGIGLQQIRPFFFMLLLNSIFAPSFYPWVNARGDDAFGRAQRGL